MSRQPLLTPTQQDLFCRYCATGWKTQALAKEFGLTHGQVASLKIRNSDRIRAALDTDPNHGWRIVQPANKKEEAPMSKPETTTVVTSTTVTDTTDTDTDIPSFESWVDSRVTLIKQTLVAMIEDDVRVDVRQATAWLNEINRLKRVRSESGAID